jgi:hypothetical protein
VLTPGNRKLGDALIWGFGLPSGLPEVCVGMTDLCRRHCYARAVERLRPRARARYEENLRLSRLPDFEQRLRGFLRAHAVAVVRLHTGGEFYSRAYAGKWLRVMRRLPAVRFFCYSRAWRDGAIRPVLERMARLANCRLWYSCDRETGLPRRAPPGVRLAWLMAAPDDLPPPEAGLAFRVRPLRRRPQTRANGVRVCPAEDGVDRKAPVTCERCGLCWRPLPADPSRRIALPLAPPTPERGAEAGD